MDSTTDIGGDAKASAPTGTVCNATSTSYQIQDGDVDRDGDRLRPHHGDRRERRSRGRRRRRRPSRRCPPYTFAAINYPGLVCYGGVGGCVEANTSTTAVSSFNTFKALNETAMSGSYAIWQDLAVPHDPAGPVRHHAERET